MSQDKGAATASGRRWHTKSRTGCSVCKSRKVKCDEQHPSCMNCLRRGLECDFLQTPDIPRPVNETPTASAQIELELLHHFTVSTALTLPTDRQVRDVWRIVVPQIGFSTKYVQNGIFALSAVHLARLNPKRRDWLIELAIQYHADSLAEALPFLSRLTPQNSTPLFLFGVLALFFNVARPKQPDDMLVLGNGVVPDWLYLVRGINSLVMAEGAILTSPVSLIFRSTKAECEFWGSHSPEHHEALSDLEARIREHTASELVRQKTLLKVVDGLARSYTFLSSQQFGEGGRVRGFYQWLFEIQDDFLNLLKKADSEALAVLAFYSVPLKQLEKYWWIEGWAVHILRRIHMLLDDEHRLWIRWPMEEIGWVPETDFSQFDES